MQDCRRISVCLTTQCNYTCRYCISTKIRQKTFIDINKLLYFIDQLQKRVKHLQISIEGDGEPTIHPQFLNLCKSLKERKINVIVHTNFSQSIDFYKKCILLKNIYLVLTWHSIEENKFNKQFFLKLIQFIAEKNYINSVQIMLEPFNITASLFAYKICNNTFAKHLQICDPISLYSYDEIKTYSDIINNNIKQHKEKSCNTEICYIDSTNYIYRCYTQYRNNIKLMSLYEFDIDKLFNGFICNIANTESCF